MGKLSFWLGAKSYVPENPTTLQGIIKDVKLYVNALGWLTLTFLFEEMSTHWSIMHLNEDYYQEILLWFLQKGADLGGLNEEFAINEDTISFDGGKTWVSIYELCDDMKTLNNFKGKSVIIKHNAELSEYLQDGAISLDEGKTWFDIDAKKYELDKRFFDNGGRVGFVAL